MKTQRIAAIDIGSNSLKLAVVEAAASDSFTIILQDRERVRLGHDTLRTRHLSDEAIRVSCEAIGRFKSIADNREVDALIAVATASVRQAKNADEFTERVEASTGVHVAVLPSMEEARLIGIASNQYFGADDSSLLNIDIGGGSTEISLMENGRPKKLFSMKLGAVGLTEMYCGTDPIEKKNLRRMREEIEFALTQPERKIRGERWELATGTSGTILNTAAILNHLSLDASPEIQTISLKELKDLNGQLAGTTLAERAGIPVISERRAEVIVAGALILEGIMDALNIDFLQTCPYALREGVVIDHMQEIETIDLPPVPDVEDLKLKDVFAIGRRFGYEEAHALHVAGMAETIFDTLAPRFCLNRSKRTLLSAAALLHDVGYHISHEAHHKHSLYLIKHSEMTGFTQEEKLIIANVARYHRKGIPKQTHEDYTALSPEDRRTVDELSGILKIADGIDRRYEGRIKDIEIQQNGKKVTLYLIATGSVTPEIHAIKNKKEGFESAFGCALSVRRKTPEAAGIGKPSA